LDIKIHRHNNSLVNENQIISGFKDNIKVIKNGILNDNSNYYDKKLYHNTINYKNNIIINDVEEVNPFSFFNSSRNVFIQISNELFKEKK
jgi:hypothetical protein